MLPLLLLLLPVLVLLMATLDCNTRGAGLKFHYKCSLSINLDVIHSILFNIITQYHLTLELVKSFADSKHLGVISVESTPKKNE